MMSDQFGLRKLPQYVNANHNLMLHEQLFPVANHNIDYIIPEITLGRLSR